MRGNRRRRRKTRWFISLRRVLERRNGARCAVSIFRSHSRGSGKPTSGNRITGVGVGHVGWKKVKGFFLLRKIRSTGRRPPPSAEALALTNLPREASNSSKTPRRSPDEAFFPIPSALFENAIAPASLLPSFLRSILSYIEKKELPT